MRQHQHAPTEYILNEQQASVGGRRGAESCLTMQPLASLELNMWMSDVLVLTEVCEGIRGTHHVALWLYSSYPDTPLSPQLPRLPTLPPLIYAGTISVSLRAPS